MQQITDIPYLLLQYISCTLLHILFFLIFTSSPPSPSQYSLSSSSHFTHTHIHTHFSLSSVSPLFFDTLIHSHTLIHPLIHSFTHSSIPTSPHSLIHSFIHSLIHLFIHSLIHSFIHSFIYSLIHTSTHPSTPQCPPRCTPCVCRRRGCGGHTWSSTHWWVVLRSLRCLFVCFLVCFIDLVIHSLSSFHSFTGCLFVCLFH